MIGRNITKKTVEEVQEESAEDPAPEPAMVEAAPVWETNRRWRQGLSGRLGDGDVARNATTVTIAQLMMD